ncbi:hypothetical protein ACIQD3_23505 [Peribacillus loiseleuriae]|uniref:hypothetical protein n=1 Tax=Peribacillus loiseleuriae TaxID=1679170 RepID=UPI00380A4DA0
MKKITLPLIIIIITLASSFLFFQKVTDTLAIQKEQKVKEIKAVTSNGTTYLIDPKFNDDTDKILDLFNEKREDKIEKITSKPSLSLSVFYKDGEMEEYDLFYDHNTYTNNDINYELNSEFKGILQNKFIE